MDLYNGEIKLGVLLENPKAKAVLERRFGKLLTHPLIATAKNMTLNQIIQVAGSQVPPQLIEETLAELRAL